MMKYTPLTLILCLFPLFPLVLFSSDTIQTGRPGQSIGGGVVGADFFQAQIGLDYNEDETDSKLNTRDSLNNIFRYGLSSRYEISALFDLANNTDEDKAFTNIQLGGRVSLNEKAHDWIPKLSFQTRIQLRNSLGEEITI